MTNREQRLEKIGDNLIACQFIEKGIGYSQHDQRIVYRFNGKIYLDFNDAYKALKKWLDEEYEEEKKPTRLITVQVPIKWNIKK